MNDLDPNRQEELCAILRSVHRRMQRLTVAVVLMGLAVFLLAAYVLGHLVNYFALDPLLYGSVSVGSALLGFFCGWFAGRRA